MKRVYYILAAALSVFAFTNLNTGIASAQSTVTVDEFLAAASCETSSQTMQYNSGPLSFLSNGTISCSDFVAGESQISCDIPSGATEGVIYASSSFSSSSGFGGPIRSFGNTIPCAVAGSTDPTATPTPAASEDPTPTPNPVVVGDTDEAGKGTLPNSGPRDFLYIVAIGAGVGFILISGVPKKLYRKVMFDV